MFSTVSSSRLPGDQPTEGLCGPLALRSVLRAMGVPPERLGVLSGVVPSRRGMSLRQLRALAARVGAPMRCVWGARGSRLPSTAVAHTAGHFIAILSANGETNPDPNPAASRDLGWRPPTGLDATFSGYLLVPEGCELDRGWRDVCDEEADGVWGRGDTVLTDLGHYGAQDLMNTGGVCRGIARYDFHGLLAALHVEDTPVWIDAPFGPQLVFTIAYNQADVYLSAQRTPSGLPLKWTHNWNHFIRFTHRMGGSAIASSVAHLFRGGGGVERYLFDGDNAESNAEVRATSRLSRTIATRKGPTSVESCTLRHLDGSVEVYGDSDGQAEPTLRLTRLIDPQGNEVRLSYEVGTRRLIEVRDAFGQSMQFHYRDGRIDYITVYDRSSRPRGTAYFFYDGLQRLTRIRDMAGIESSFGWATSERGIDPATAEDMRHEQLGAVAVGPDPHFMRWMKTPYGVTTFQTGARVGIDGMTSNERWIEVTMPNGDTERVEFRARPRPSPAEGLDVRGPAMAEQGEAAPRSILDKVAPFRDAPLPTEHSQVEFQWELFWLLDSHNIEASVEHRRREYLLEHVPNQWLDRLNTLYWNPRAYRRAGGERPPPRSENPAPISGTPSNRLLDHRYAQVTHWMRSPYSSPEQVRPTGVVDSSVMPGENRVWYCYQGQTLAAQLTSSPALPARIARNLPPSTPRPPEDAGVSIEYDRLGNPTSITDPMGRQTTLRYAYSTVDGHERADLSEVLRLASSGVFDSLASLEGYNALHLPERIVDAAGGVTGVVYNRHGQPLRVVRPDGSEIRWTYDTTDAARSETWGNLVEVDTPSGTTSFTYNGRNLVETATAPDGASRTFHYDELDRLVRVVHVDGTYEAIGYQRLDPETGVGLVFRGDGEIERESPTGDDPRVKVIALEWTTVRDRDGREVRRAFDPQRRLTRVSVGAGAPTIFRYPDLGGAISDELLRMIDGNGHETVWRQRNDTPDMARFDDRAVEMVRPDGTVTRYTWDVQGRLQRTEEVSAGRFTEVTRLADGRPFEVLAGDGIEALVQQFDYDPFVPRMTRARTSRLDGASPSGEVLDDTGFAYTPPGVFGAGRLMLTRHARSGVHVAHTYDELGRLKTRTTGVGHAASSALEIEYGGNGLVRSTSDVLGATLFCYNDTCDDSAASGARRDASRLTLATLPNGALLRFLYAPPDPRREPKLTGYETRTAPTLMSAGDLRHRVSFDLSPAGRRTAEIQTWRQGGVSLPDWRRAYSYDASGRLERVSHAVVVDGRSSFFGDDQYRFDDNGNLRTETNTGVGSGGRMIGTRSATSTYDDGDRLIARMAQTLWPEPSTRNVLTTVDDAGQMRYDGQAHYAWDALGRLQGVTRDRAPSRPSSFERDTFGRVTRIRDAAGVRDLVWDGLTLLEERDAETREVIRAYAASGFTQGGASYYYLRDPLGSVVGLMDQSGNVVKTWSYDAWGFRTLSWQAEGAEDVNPALGYAGYLQHEESGLCLMPARAYSPALRRWLSRDPIGLAGGDTNLYSYVRGDSINRVDPLGLFDYSQFYDYLSQAQQHAWMSHPNYGEAPERAADRVRYLQNLRQANDHRLAYEPELIAAEHLFVVPDGAFNSYQDEFTWIESQGVMDRHTSGLLLAIPFGCGSVAYEVAKFTPLRKYMASEPGRPASPGQIGNVVANLMGAGLGALEAVSDAFNFWATQDAHSD